MRTVNRNVVYSRNQRVGDDSCELISNPRMIAVNWSDLLIRSWARAHMPRLYSPPTGLSFCTIARWHTWSRPNWCAVRDDEHRASALFNVKLIPCLVTLNSLALLRCTFGKAYIVIRPVAMPGRWTIVYTHTLSKGSTNKLTKRMRSVFLFVPPPIFRTWWWISSRGSHMSSPARDILCKNLSRQPRYSQGSG